MPEENSKYLELSQSLIRLVKFFKPKAPSNLIKPPEMMVIMTLHFLNRNGNHSVNPSDISDELGFSKSALTAILNSLEEKMLIERSVDEHDRRRIILKPTQGTIDLIEDHVNSVKNSALKLSKSFNKEDTEKLIELINKAIAIING